MTKAIQSALDNFTSQVELARTVDTLISLQPAWNQVGKAVWDASPETDLSGVRAQLQQAAQIAKEYGLEAPRFVPASARQETAGAAAPAPAQMG